MCVTCSSFPLVSSVCWFIVCVYSFPLPPSSPRQSSSFIAAVCSPLEASEPCISVPHPLPPTHKFKLLLKLTPPHLGWLQVVVHVSLLRVLCVRVCACGSVSVESVSCYLVVVVVVVPIASSISIHRHSPPWGLAASRIIVLWARLLWLAPVCVAQSITPSVYISVLASIGAVWLWTVTLALLPPPSKARLVVRHRSPTPRWFSLFLLSFPYSFSQHVLSLLFLLFAVVVRCCRSRCCCCCCLLTRWRTAAVCTMSHCIAWCASPCHAILVDENFQIEM